MNTFSAGRNSGLFPACKKSLLIALFIFPITVFSQKLNEDSINKVIRETPHDSVRIDAMLEYANYMIRHKMQDSALKLLDRANAMAYEKNYLPGMAQAYLIMGSYYNKNSEWGKSIEAFEASIKIAQGIKDEIRRKKSLRSAYNNLGGVYNTNGDFSSSLEYRLRTMEVIESMPNPTPIELAIGLLNTASDYRQLKEFKKAREYINRVTPLVGSIPDRLKMEYYYEYYQILVGSNDNGKALQVLASFDSTLQVADLSDFQQLDYNLLSKKLHGIYEMEHPKNYSNAYNYFQACLPLAEKIKKNTEIVSSYYNLGWALLKMERYPQAVQSLTRSYEMAMENKLKNNAFKAANLLADAYQNQNKAVEAFNYSRIALALKDSIVQEDATEQLNFLEAKYQYEKKEKQISNLEKTNQEKEFVIRRKNWLITGSLILLGLLSILSIVIYRYYKNRQKLLKQQKILHEEQLKNMEKQQQVVSLQSMINGQESERIRIAKDLHDGLGGFFSTVKMHYSTLQHELPEIKNNALYRKTFDLIDNASDELRKVAHNMMPEVLMKVGLIEALRDFCNNINSGKLLNISLQAYGMEKRLGSSTEIMIYRILQELVNNIIKHAYATEAIIQFIREGNRLSITIEDNGRGFNTLEAEEKRTMGISTVKSRVDYLNGKLTIDSRKNIGTTIMIDILLNEN